ncbi:GAF domain-containing protein [Sphaerisporangium sp. TRM90804]|uniref:GAF domain-containing protein n=1 Tax=Sphaerisporangium sp. TRM90804 TaxID=3031113 RepID=UPI00244C486A|nr:GAF domain-containing protein [Sphaerisporangium sp. TRM90804]MDH2425415.1 hypothetical protein [Sphaerisporangium sp. TRM90804]
MIERSGVQAFEEEFLRFQRRLDDLRESRSVIGGGEEGAEWAEAVLSELDLAVEELRVQHEEIIGWADQAVAERVATDQERHLLRAAFTGSPAPALLVTGDEAIIRRANQAALDLLDISHAYATGRSFPVFVDLRFRAALRSAFAAAVRQGTRSVHTRLVRRRRPPVDLTMVLTRLDVPGARPHILLTAAPVREHAEPGPALDGPWDDAERAGRDELRAGFTRLLLSPGLTLRGAGQALLDAFADWLFVDLVDDEGGWRREVVLGRAPASPAVTRSLRTPGELPRQVQATGRTRLVAHVDDPGLLGHDDEGASIVTRLAAGSVVCVPLSTGNEPSGAVTAVRASARPPFSLVETALLEELCGHLASRLALEVPYRP